MMGFSLYLTQHFFDVRFPTGLSGGSMCNFNSFFNCDTTTNSPLGAPFNIPISIFGVVMGFLVFLGIIFKNEDYERTVFFSLIINAFGCVVLFFYSLFILKGLCPFCTLYYLTSWFAVYYFKRNSETFTPSIPYLISFALVVGVTSILMRNHVTTKIEQTQNSQSSIAKSLIAQYYSLPNLGNPSYPSIYKLNNAPEAKIKMVIFSDFECPACKMLSEQMTMIISKYGNNVDISYYFYPLDNNCNPAMERPLHQWACKAAYASVCMPSSDFYQVHEIIFKNQEKFSEGFIDQYIKENKLESCVNSPKTKDTVSKLIAAATPFNVSSTPTFLLNGVKIDGVLPFDQLSILFDEILKRAGK